MTTYTRALFGSAAAFNFVIAGGLLFLRPALTPLLRLEPVSGSNLLVLNLAAGLIAVFGYAYACAARDPVRYRPYISLGVIGKLLAVTVALMTWLTAGIDGRLPALAAGDLLFAVLFMDYLRRTRATA